MNQTTEIPHKEEDKREFSSEFLLTLFALTGSALLLLVFGGRVSSSWDSYQMEHPTSLWQLFDYPWLDAARLTVLSGLTQFSGHGPYVSTSLDHIVTLCSLLLHLVIGPTLCLLCWKEFANRNRSAESTSRVKAAMIGYVVGGMVTFSLVVPIIPAAIVQYMATQRLHRDQNVQNNRDMMINDINQIAFDAREYSVVPVALGGGGGSYPGFTIRANVSSSADGKYVLESLTQHSFRILGQSNKYPNASIIVSVDSAGRLNRWKYAGLFQ